MAADVGDPIWGLKTYKTDDFRKRWDSAVAVFVDVKGLKDLRRGDKDERVRELQKFLKEKGYLDDITGTYDVKTTEAVRKFQGYYKLPETGNLDDLTALILNSRMMDGGPKLNAAHDME
jgi:peptidoglycan hydrolase-like protein with peptidoglycan-binding domain